MPLWIFLNISSGLQTIGKLQILQRACNIIWNARTEVGLCASSSGEDCPHQNINKQAGAPNTPCTDGGKQYGSHRFTETNYMMNFDPTNNK